MAQQRASAPFEGLRYQVLAAAFRMHARGGPASLREFHYHWPDYQRLVMWKVCAAVSVLAPPSGIPAVQSLVVCKVPVARSLPSLWPQSGMHPAAVCGWSCGGCVLADAVGLVVFRVRSSKHWSGKAHLPCAVSGHVPRAQNLAQQCKLSRTGVQQLSLTAIPAALSAGTLASPCRDSQCA